MQQVDFACSQDDQCTQAELSHIIRGEKMSEGEGEIEAVFRRCDSFLTHVPYSKRYHEILEERSKLPAWTFKQEFVDLVSRNQVTILVGDTGSGKTTQCGQFLLAAGLAEEGLVGCTQPRRVAAMSVAERVAQEMDVRMGDEVGYSIRFDNRTSNLTRMKFMTDGMLLREAMTDPMLSRYSVIILDEAHERTIATDILFALVKDVLLNRPRLKLVVMSATLDSGAFQEYFNGPIIEIPGRLYKVDLHYHQSAVKNYVETAVNVACDITREEPPGDVLLFLTGEDEIEEACREIRERVGDKAICMPLYSSLPPAQQQKVFRAPPPGLRKIVVSTNVAETSITIDGIVYVIDPGLSKQKLYNPRLGIEMLAVTEISRSSAKQRAGRAGRTQDGKCFRLYTEDAYNTKLEEQTFPEILRTNLTNVILMLLRLGVSNLVTFDFMTPPAPETMMKALLQLIHLGAIDKEAKLLPKGVMMAEFPLDPEHAACLIESHKFDCSPEVLSIVAMMGVPNPFMRPRGSERQADSAKMQFVHGDGDHLTLLNLWHAFIHELEAGTNVEQWCYDNFVQYRSLNTAMRVREHLHADMMKMSLDPDCEGHYRQYTDKQYYPMIRKALLAGFFTHVAHYNDRKGHLYEVVRETSMVQIHPSSVFKHHPEWLMYSDFVQTSRPFIRTVTQVRGEWLLEIAPHYFNVEDLEGEANFYEPSKSKTRLQEILKLQRINSK